MSSRLVSQHPSRKKPVIGLNEHTSRRSPSTLREASRRPPSSPTSSGIHISRPAGNGPVGSLAQIDRSFQMERVAPFRLLLRWQQLGEYDPRLQITFERAIDRCLGRSILLVIDAP